MNNYDLDVIYGLYKMGEKSWSDYVYAYHITYARNMASIKSKGLQARECQATTSDYRQKAVYLFTHAGDAYDRNVRRFLFGNETDLVVVKVRIPKKAYHRLRYDGLFNMSCQCTDGTFPTGIQCLDDIPAQWIWIE